MDNFRKTLKCRISAINEKNIYYALQPPVSCYSEF